MFSMQCCLAILILELDDPKPLSYLWRNLLDAFSWINMPLVFIRHCIHASDIAHMYSSSYLLVHSVNICSVPAICQDIYRMEVVPSGGGCVLCKMRL